MKKQIIIATKKEQRDVARKGKNGITLIALVITIIILLILAGVSIVQLSGSGLFGKAKQAKEKSKNAQDDENVKLEEYEGWLGNYTGGNSSSDGNETSEGENKGFVQYNAGEWTEEEIEELKTNSLYNINTAKAASKTEGLNFTFGGFTYKGDSTNASYINNGTVITNRNQSVAPRSGYGTPTYEGWQILEVKDSSGNTYSKEYEVKAKLENAEKEKIYVSKLVHAGSPENFAFWYQSTDDGYRAEYILSGGQRQTTYNTYKARDWSMYKDKAQLNLIDEVHAMTYDEALAITGSNLSTPGIYYWIASASHDYNLWIVKLDGSMTGDMYNNKCLGVRPVVSLKSGVYIKSGNGTNGNPYVLGKD